ncbi:type III secretion effector protein [Pseudomonas sp. G2-4]|uniref:SpaN/EivJ family type III secretion system needle length determinant n=1 Tax=Pseudomonas sp. G2-4 TaxID=1506334 RepID=UPI0024B97C75|nr:type III secretion effector protein [Pseudomonas sp. G2-4]WHS62120.1 type III secretion effector protein [Pseudomonas sp. G2-4]
MKEVSRVPSLPVLVLDPVDEGPLDELLDPLVAVQEDELPQGVLDLMALLVRPHREPMDNGRALAWRSMSVVQGGAEVEHDGERSGAQGAVEVEAVRAPPRARVAMTFPHAGPLPSQMARHPLSQRLGPAGDQSTLPTYSASIEPPRREPFPSEQSSALGNEPLPQAPLSLQDTSHPPSVVTASILSSTLPPALDVMVETLPGPNRGFLQVPFNRGAASGQVTISRVSEEPTRHLTISPSNALVFEQLKEPFALAREPAWRLADSGGEQPRQGSQQGPDEDADEQAEHPA